MMFGYNAEKIRKDFPVLKQPIIYFDNACMSLKPVHVLKKMEEYYTKYTACAGRSSHRLAAKVEEEVDLSRMEIKRFINAKSAKEIIFTRNTTEGINIVANSIGLKKGDEVLITDKEHNSNLVPWLKMRNKGVTLKIARTNPDGTLDIGHFSSLLGNKTKLVSVVFTSNVDGVTNPVKHISKIAHENGSLLLVDGAQAVPSMEVDVRNLDVDFLAFSGHKMLGPTGTGVLYGKESVLDKMEQFIVGGETVIDTTHESYKMEELPMRFEAGLQDYAGIIGFGEACRYLNNVGMKKISQHESVLNSIITEGLASNPKISILGPADPKERGGVFSFNIKGMSPHEISRILDASKGILTRSGMHCVHSWYNSRGINGSVRASLYLYNTEEEAGIFVEQIRKISGLSV